MLGAQVTTSISQTENSLIFNNLGWYFPLTSLEVQLDLLAGVGLRHRYGGWSGEASPPRQHFFLHLELLLLLEGELGHTCPFIFFINNFPPHRDQDFRGIR